MEFTLNYFGMKKKQYNLIISHLNWIKDSDKFIALLSKKNHEKYKNHEKLNNEKYY